MPVPTLITDLSTTADLNAPGGEDSPGSLDNVQRAHASFIAKLRDESQTLAGKDASGGYPGLTLFKLNLRNAANTFTSWFTNATTAARTWTMPDKDGTVAMTNDIVGKNVIINGGFTVNQRAYVSAATLAAGAFGHDRWKAGASGGNYSFTQLASDTTITIAASKTLIQVVEDKNVQATSYVLSWTGTALARYAVNSATPAGSYAASPIIITGQTVGTVMSIEFGNGASTGTLGTVQLEAGSTVTPFERRPYSVDLDMCKRYLQVLADGSGNQAIANGVAISTTAGQLQRFLSPAMRTSPTLSASAASDFIAITATGSSAGAPSTLTGAVLQPIYARIDFSGTPANLVAGIATSIQSGNANARLYLSSEL